MTQDLDAVAETLYVWNKCSNDNWGEKYKVKESWCMNFYPDEKDSLPIFYRGPRETACSYGFNASIFDPKQFDRPTKLKELSKETSKPDEERVITTITKEKIVFTHPYEGLVDAKLRLESNDSMEGYGHGTVYFSEGKLVAGFGPCDFVTPITSVEDYMASHQNKFGRAFEIDDFSQHLGNFFGNSNLPKRMKQRFRDLYE